MLALQIEKVRLEILKTAQMAEGQEKICTFLAIDKVLEDIQKQVYAKEEIVRTLQEHGRYEDEEVIIH